VAHRFASIAAANGFISTRFRARQGAITISIIVISIRTCARMALFFLLQQQFGRV